MEPILASDEEVPVGPKKRNVCGLKKCIQKKAPEGGKEGEEEEWDTCLFNKTFTN